MMNSISICIIEKDARYIDAFINTVALCHPGYAVTGRNVCGGECPENIDACICFEPCTVKEEDPGVDGGRCEKSFVPSCGKYAGVSRILGEARAFILGREEVSERGPGRASETQYFHRPFEQGALVVVFSRAGGAGASTAAVGIGRELARYRGDSVLYLSHEDIEDAGLFPYGVHAMGMGETLYRYLRIADSKAEPESFVRLFRAAAGRDEYKLYRFCPDDNLNRLACLSPAELYIFLKRACSALKLTRIVLDFGTRLQSLRAFIAQLEEGEAVFVEVCADEKRVAGKKNSIPDEGIQPLRASFPYCEEDIKNVDGHTEVGLANNFGLAVKEVCDRILEATG